MTSLFLQILAGDTPGHVVYESPDCFVILAPTPIRIGHVLVIPKPEIDHWIDIPQPLLNELTAIMKRVGYAIQQEFSPVKVGIIVGGLVVRHAHFHLVPIHSLDDLDLSRQQKSPDPQEVADAAARLRRAIQHAVESEKGSIP